MTSLILRLTNGVASGSVCEKAKISLRLSPRRESKDFRPRRGYIPRLPPLTGAQRCAVGIAQRVRFMIWQITVGQPPRVL